MAVSHVLAQEPYCHINRELAITLQVRIYLGSSTIIQKRTAVKEAWRGLVHSKCAQNGCIVYESFLNERRTIMILSQMPDCKGLFHWTVPVHIRCTRVDWVSWNSVFLYSGVITGLDQWEDSNCYYLAMEHCEAEFYNYINRYHLTLERERFVEEQTLKKQIPASEPTLWIRTCSLFFRQICEAVKWMHSKGYCHLDLSLENTMISDLSSLKIKLIDFGLARYFPDGNFECDRQDKRIGKTNYMAPEVCCLLTNYHTDFQEGTTFTQLGFISHCIHRYTITNLSMLKRQTSGHWEPCCTWCCSGTIRTKKFMMSSLDTLSMAHWKRFWCIRKTFGWWLRMP